MYSFFNKPLDKSSVDYISFSYAKVCHICEDELNGSDDKVRNHDHFTGKYRGAAHRSCNSLLRMPTHIPVVFHNLAKYDAHFFIKSLHVIPGKIDCIPNNEKFITFSKRITVGTYIDKKDSKEKDIRREIRFKDSFNFMQSFLSCLVDNLPSHSLKNLAMGYPHDAEKFTLMRRKGVFPYDWFDSLKKLKVTQLPEKDSFFSRLTDSHISNEDYQHAQNV